MTTASDTKWTVAVRLLALLSGVLGLLVVLEGRSLRLTRAELQQLRSERDQVKAGVASVWAQQSAAEMTAAIQWLDGFYAESTEGFGKVGGLCASGTLNSQAIVDEVVGEYARARANGRAQPAAIEAMKTAIQKSDGYRAVHPDLAVK